MQHVNQMNFQAPPNEQDKMKWASEMKLKYTRALLTMESSRANLARIDHMIKERADKGNPLSPEELANFNAKKEQLQKSYQEGHNFVERTRQQLGVNKAAQQQNGGAQGPKPGPNQQQQPATPRMQAPAQPGGGQAAGAGANPMQNSAATVNAAIEAAKNQQLAAARGLVGQQGQQGLPQSQIVPPSAQPQVQQSPVSHTAQAQPQQQQPQTQNQTQPQTQNQNQSMQQPHIKLEPGTHPNPNLPPPLNTALASAAAASGLPSAGTPTQMNSARSALQTPQSATPITGQPRPLSHSAALSMANQRTGSIAMPGGQPQTGTPTQSTPGTGSGVIGAAQQQPHPGQMPQHPGQHGVQPSQQSLQSKLPIPKVLPEKATQVPTPVPTLGGIGSGRPTFSGGSGIGGGVMGQPALAKTPAYQLEGEGDRVLNKKKLDELVRQVCGGTAEGDEGSLLTPDVEEVCFFPLFTLPFLHSVLQSLFLRGYACTLTTALVRPQPGRQLRGQRVAQRVPECKGARV
jgi:transcription initiation factor TFIID subunit 12